MTDRRTVLKLLALGVLGPGVARAQGFAGLGSSAEGFAPVVPGYALDFPRDHGAHPEFRTEWWYVTANLKDEAGEALGLQWTLFRQALARPVAGAVGFQDPTVWMGHAAVTRSSGHRFAEKIARGSTGEAFVTEAPFAAVIDDWSFSALEGTGSLDRAGLRAQGEGFRYDLALEAEGPLVLHGEKGFSRKSERGEASYYYSQPFYAAAGTIEVDGRRHSVNGSAWLDREWSSQPLARDQTGWDWFSLHLDDGRKLMLFQVRSRDGGSFRSGTLIEPDGKSHALASQDLTFTPLRSATVAGRNIPVSWHVSVRSFNVALTLSPLRDDAWMGTSVSYWEGPVRFEGSGKGVGYLEMTGY